MPSLTLPGRVHNANDAIARFGQARVDEYAEALMVGDPLADAFAADCAQIGMGKGMKMLARWLDGEAVEDIEGAPESLFALTAALGSVPDYVDFEQIERGQAAFSRNAREAGISLSTTSLVSGYNNPDASRPLVVTGRFSEMAPVRAIETSMWVFDVARPGGLQRDSSGFKRTARVRMIHAFVRRHILSTDWNSGEHGVPINQADLAYTVVEFLWLPVRSMQMLGIYYTPEDLAAIYAMWRYMGYLMGVDTRMLVTNGIQAQEYEDLHVALSPEPDDDCRLLTHALLRDVLAVDLKQASGAIGLVGRVFGGEGLVMGLTRSFVGDKIADALEIPNNAWKYTRNLVFPVMYASSRARYSIPGANERRMRSSLGEIDRLLATNAELRGMKHDLVDQSPASASAKPGDHHPAVA